MSELTGLTGHLDKIRADQLTLFSFIHGVTLFGFFTCQSKRLKLTWEVSRASREASRRETNESDG
jgi:hypothetical protein